MSSRNGEVRQKTRTLIVGAVDPEIEKSIGLSAQMGRLAQTVLTKDELRVYNWVVKSGSLFSEIRNRSGLTLKQIGKLWESSRIKVNKAWVASNLKVGR